LASGGSSSNKFRQFAFVVIVAIPLKSWRKWRKSDLPLTTFAAFVPDVKS
jgi:hypothetical protein